MSKRPKSKTIPPVIKRAKDIKVSFPEKFVREGNSHVLRKQAVSLPFKPRAAMSMDWTEEKGDLIGSWSWGESRDWTGHTWDHILLPFLTEYAGKTWAEIEGETAGNKKRHKAYEAGDICKEARERLSFLELDLDEVFRFRVKKQPRFYGFRIQHIFFALWWDAKHLICPFDIQDRGKVRKRR